MALSNRYGVYTCSVNDGSAKNFTQMKSWNARTQSQKDRIIPGGAVDPSATMLKMAEPQVELVTTDLVSLITTHSVSLSAGLNCTGGGTFRLQQRTDGGTFTGSNNNVSYTSTKGYLYPTRISGRQDDDGIEATLRYCALWDGSTEPLVRNTAVTYASLTPTFVSNFYLGPVYVNGTIINGITSVTIDTGLDFQPFRHSGETYARAGSIITRQPVITFEMLEAESAVLGTLFNAALAGTIAVYFQKGSDGGSRVAAASTVHCKISATAGAWGTDNVTVSHPGDGTVTVMVQPTSTLSAQTASAIP